MTDVDVTGGCFCGTVRYRAQLDPSSVDTCYCSYCTHTVGTTVSVWAHVPADHFEFTGGEPTRFE